MLAIRSPDRGKIAPQLERIVAEIDDTDPVVRARWSRPRLPPRSEIRHHPHHRGMPDSSGADRVRDGTTNGEVRSACRRRISKLADERRIHQTVQERYKIQTCRKGRKAYGWRERNGHDSSCRKSKSLEVVSGGGGGTRARGMRRADDPTIRFDGRSGERRYEDAGDEDGGCHDRVLKYLGGRGG